MWASFFVCAAIIAAMLVVPGYLQIRAARLGRADSFCLAPFVSAFEYCVIGAVAGLCGVAMDAEVLVGFVLLVSAAAWGLCTAVRRRRAARIVPLPEEKPSYGGRLIAAYIAFASLVTLYAYILPLNGPESFAEIFDNAFHINVVHAFMETGRFSILQTTYAPTLPLAPLSDISYYPAAWHVVAALGGSIVDGSAALAENAANVVFVALVFPTGMYLFLSEVFRGRRRLAFMGAGIVCVPAFVAFPWGFLVAGPLYANLASFSFVPAVMAVFMRLLRCSNRGLLARYAVLFVVGCGTLVAAQPNAIFAAIVILAPVATMGVYHWCGQRFSRGKSLVIAGAFVLVLVLIWLAARALPLFAGVIGQTWTPYVSNPFQGVLDYVILGDRNAVAQELLCALVLLGALWCLAQRRLRWLLFSYLFFGIGYLSAAWTYHGIFGTFFSGFWYNDVDRLAACAVLVMIPLACMGMVCVKEVVSSVAKKALNAPNEKAFAIGVVALLVVFIYAPNFILPGHGEQPTAFGGRRAQAESLAHERIYLDQAEEDFIEKCKQIIGDSEGVVVNMPFDGSVFAYSQNDLNTLYRHYFLGNTSDLRAIQGNLAGIAEDKQVQEAVENLGARYVILLDSPEGEDSTVNPAFYDPSYWQGILDVGKGAPGFKLLLSEGDMRLYEIEGAATR